MLRSCKYCGRIHDTRYDCGKKQRGKKNVTNADRFRWTKAWQERRKEIRERDDNVCQICARKLYDTDRQYNYTNISVHHAIPIEKDWSKRLEEDNLLTLCDKHHEMAEAGEIQYQVIKRIIDEQEKKRQRE